MLATLNLNGDYISERPRGAGGAAGRNPGGNIIGDGLALFEATTATGPGHAGKDMVNPGSLILSGGDDAGVHGLAGSGDRWSTPWAKTIQDKS